MKDYVEEFRRRIADIDEDSKGVRIINAGVMNHGKSSLLNSLLDAEHFAEQDIRTTMVNKEVQWFNDVYLVDTPGLNAEASDDKEAYAAYRRANMIIFCHTVKVGELREAEMKAINTIKSLFENERTFWEHFCLVLTFLDADSEESIDIIKNKSLSDIEKHCGYKDFPVFIVSNSRYKKGRTESKLALVKKSGIPELREFLKSNCEKWRSENSKFRAARISREKADIMKELEREQEIVKSKIKIKKDKVKQEQKYLFNRIKDLFNERAYNDRTLDNMISVYNTMSDEYDALIERHNREYY